MRGARTRPDSRPIQGTRVSLPPGRRHGIHYLYFLRRDRFEKTCLCHRNRLPDAVPDRMLIGGKKRGSVIG